MKTQLPVKWVWAGLTFSLFLYMGVALIVPTPAKPEGAGFTTLDWILVALSAVSALVSLMIYARSLSVKALKSSLLSQQGDINKVVEDLFLKYVICWAINEMICLYGLILKFVEGDLNLFMAGFLASLFLNILMFPKIDMVLRDRRSA